MSSTRWGSLQVFFSFLSREKFSLFFPPEKRGVKAKKKKSLKRFLLFLSYSQMPLPPPSTRPGQRPRSMLLMPLAVAAARRAAASCSSRAKMMSALASSSASSATLYSMRRRSPLLLHFPSPTFVAATPAIRRPFAASMSAIASSPRNNKRLSNRSSSRGQLGTPLKAAAGGGGAGNVAAAASAPPSHCSGCGVSLQGSDPNLPG